MVVTINPEKPAESSFADDAMTALFKLTWFAVRCAAVLLWWAALFPTINWPVAAAGYIFLTSTLGWMWGVCIVLTATVLHNVWRMLWPQSFHRFVSERIWKRRRRW